jgi:hypothetical protein
LRRLAFLAMFVCAVAACVEPDLGQIPFRCHSGVPECPEGYYCAKQGSDRFCIKEGTLLPDTSSRRDLNTVVDDFPVIQPDTKVAKDQAIPRSEGSVVKWDGRLVDAWPDFTIPKYDSGQDMLLCTSNNDCKDPSSSCCCALPFIPIFKFCLSFCLDPICF